MNEYRTLMAVFVALMMLSACSNGAGSDSKDNGSTDVIADADGDATGDASGSPEDALGNDLSEPKMTLKLVFDPEQDNYLIDTPVTVTAVGLDGKGNEVEAGVLGPLKIAPEGIAESHKEGAFKFLAQGEVLVSACLADEPGVCCNRSAGCDMTGPTIEIISPVRGAMLSGDSVIEIYGKVSDPAGLDGDLLLNGEAVVIEESGSFAGSMTAVHGLNIITCSATDGFGNVGDVTTSFLYTTKYLPQGAEDPAVALINDALLAYLDDLLFYSDNPAADNTLSYLFKVVLADLDIGALLPNPVVEDQDLSVLCLWDTFDVSLNDLAYGEPQVKLYPVDGGLALQITIPNFSGAFAIETDGFACVDYYGTVTAAALVADAIIVLSASPDGDLVVDVDQTDVKFEGLEFQLDGIPGTLLNWLLNLLNDTVANLLVTEFEKQVEELVAGLTDSLTETLAEPIELPIDPFIPGNDPMLLKIYIRFSNTTFTPGGADLNANMSITAPDNIGIENPGSLGRAACLTGGEPVFLFDLDNPSPVEIAAHLDVVNQALHSLWVNGALHLSITAEGLAEMGTDVGKYGVADLNLNTGPLLPPVITSCNEDGELTAQIGDFYVDAQFSMLTIPADIQMYLFLEVGADISIIEGEVGPEIGLSVADPNFVIVDIETVNDAWLGKESMLTGLITDTLVPMLLESLQEKPISFALPTINLGGLLGNTEENPEAEPGALDGKELLIDLQSITQALGYLHIKGGVKVQDVPPPPEETPEEPTE